MQPIHRSSLVQAACAHLRAAVASGACADHLPGEMELCRRLRVSRATLRSALAQLESEGLLEVSQGRRRKIVPPANRPSRIVAEPARLERVVILSPVAWGRLTAAKLLWIDELREVLATRGVPLDFVVSAAAALRRPARMLGNLTSQHARAVWLLLGSTAPMQRWFADQHLPAVVAGSAFEGIALTSVDSDYFAACRHAAGRFLARGCQRLGLIIPQAVLAGDEESEAGFRNGAGDHPVTVARHDGTTDGLSRVLDRLMRTEAPDGLLVCHATHAVTVLGRLILAGKLPPREVKLISRDDDPFLDHVTPRLARYSVRPRAFAARLLKVIEPWLEGATPLPRAEKLLPEFIDGDTL